MYDLDIDPVITRMCLAAPNLPGPAITDLHLIKHDNVDIIHV